MPAALQHIEETDQIGVDIGVRVGERMAHARLRREMNHDRESIGLKQGRHAGTVREVELLERKSLVRLQFAEPGAFFNAGS